LWNIPTVNKHVASVAADLKQNTALKNIEICSCHLNAEAGLVLVDMLRLNKHLQSAVLEVDWGNIMFGKPISAIIQDNNVLTNLQMICVQNGLSSPRTRKEYSTDDCSAEAHAELVCGALQRNCTLQMLTLEFQQSRTYRNDNSRLKRAFSGPLLETLGRYNLTLQHFALTGGRCNVPVVWGKAIDFQMRLNNAGLAQWSDCCKNLAEYVISVHHEHDLSTLFYILSMHPHLLMLPRQLL
jgi:hypothetical protein